MTRVRLRLRGALLVGTLVPLLLVAVVAIVVSTALTNSLSDAEASIRSEQILYTANLVTTDVIDSETGMRGFVIAPQEPFLEPYNSGTARLPGHLEALSALLANDPRQLERIARIGQGFRAWNESIAVPVIAAVRASSAAQAGQIIASGAGKRLLDSIRADLDALTAAERDQATARLTESRTTSINVRQLSFWGTVLAVVLGAILAIVFARRISRRVRLVSMAATSLAAGNLAHRVTVTGRDEVADLATAFNDMATRLEAAALAEQEATEALRRRTTETEIANRELVAFSYSVSHDLRAPLRSLDGFSQALMEDYADKLDATALDYLTRVRGASVRMGDLIDDLLRLSRISRDPIRMEPVDLTALASGVVADLRAAEPARSVEVVIQPRMRATGDLRLVQIALENLLGNAWKFTRERADPRIEVRQEVGPDGPQFIVADNGAGFDMRYAANLFGPFQRMHAVERFAGTGIGLATVQRIIHRHGGTIEAESEVDQGTRIRFTLGPGGGSDVTVGPAGVPAVAGAGGGQGGPAAVTEIE